MISISPLPWPSPATVYFTLPPPSPQLLAAHLIAAAEELPLRLPSRRSEGVGEVEPEPEAELGLWVQWSGAAQAGVRDGALRLQDERLHCAASAF